MKITIKTKFKELDKIINGFGAGEFISIFGRPGIGKTSLAISFINNISKKSNGIILFFNMEMPADMLKKRLVSDNVEVITNLNYIDDIENKCNAIKGKVSLIVIDYFQLIETSNTFNTRVEKKENIVQKLKKIAAKLEAPVIVLSQLDRRIENREDKSPILDDIKNSGLLQISDKIICLHSDDYYTNLIWEDVEVITLKNNTGALGTTKFKFNKNNCSFEEKNNI